MVKCYDSMCRESCSVAHARSLESPKLCTQSFERKCNCCIAYDSYRATKFILSSAWGAPCAPLSDFPPGGLSVIPTLCHLA